MHDKYKRRFQGPRAGIGDRLRRQIATEAARRLYGVLGPLAGETTLREANEAAYYTAKRKAAAVLGHRVRPGDLPSDSEVREQVLALSRTQNGQGPPADEDSVAEPDPEEGGETLHLADHLDRFALYKLRLEPLAAVKLDPKSHPEGDALYHSLQVFERARDVRPFDEELLTAALLHEVGRAIDPRDAVASGLDALREAITPRTAWLIAHLDDAHALRRKALDSRTRQAIEASEWFEDLLLLRDFDEAGRVVGAPVGTVAEVLDFIRGLDDEDYLRG